MSSQRPWLFKLLREATYRLRPFWCTCCRNFGAISGTGRLNLNLTWKIKYQVKGHGCVSCSWRIAIVWDHFGKRAGVISGRYPVLHLLTLNFTLKIKCQVRGHGRISCSGRLAIVWDHFGTRADVITGRYPVPRRLTLWVKRLSVPLWVRLCLTCPNNGWIATGLAKSPPAFAPKPGAWTWTVHLLSLPAKSRPPPQTDCLLNASSKWAKPYLAARQYCLAPLYFRLAY